MIAYHRQKTVAEHLVRAKVHPAPREGVRTREPRPGFKKCMRFGGSGCILCSYSTQSTTHTSRITGETFQIKSEITCTSKNILYDLWFNKCSNSAMAFPGSDSYVGRTRNSVAERFSAHKSDIVTGKVYKLVAEHFNQPGHKPSDLRFQPFEIIHSNDPTLLASRESYWIAKKKILHGGLNRQK